MPLYTWCEGIYTLSKGWAVCVLLCTLVCEVCVCVYVLSMCVRVCLLFIAVPGLVMSIFPFAQKFVMLA